jgi:hypothetical protein
MYDDFLPDSNGHGSGGYFARDSRPGEDKITASWALVLFDK